MGVHHAATFRYQEYQQETSQLVELVDQHNYELLKAQACQTIEYFQNEWSLTDLGQVKYQSGVTTKILTQEWPLVKHGEDSLATVAEIEAISIPTSQDIGYWFLIILAKYLENCISPLANWYVLYAALESLGWPVAYRDLLFYGLPTYKLLKPNLTEPLTRPLTADSPYWLWVHPSGAWSGWLATAEVIMLVDKLHNIRDQVTNWDIGKIPNIDSSNPIVIGEYREYLKKGLDDTLVMLSTAKKHKSGLFISITI